MPTQRLRRGFRNLRFDPGLELEFRNYYWNRFLFRTRIMLVAGAVLLSLFALKANALFAAFRRYDVSKCSLFNCTEYLMTGLG